MRSLLFTSISLFILCILAFSSAHTAVHGTVITMDGERFESVWYYVDKTYQIVSFEHNGTERSISFHKIKALLDGSGQDRTAEFLGVNREAVQKQWISEEGDEFGKHSKPRWNILLMPHVSWDMSTRDDYERFNDGPGFGLACAVVVGHKSAIRFSVDRVGISLEKIIRFESFYPEILDYDLKFSTWRYLVSGEYFKYYDDFGDNPSHYFCYAGLGAISRTLKGKFLLRDESNGKEAWVQDEDSQTKLCTTFGFGLVKGFSSAMAVNMCTHFDMVFIDGEGGGSMTDAFLVGIQAGIAYRL